MKRTPKLLNPQGEPLTWRELIALLVEALTSEWQTSDKVYARVKQLHPELPDLGQVSMDVLGTEPLFACAVAELGLPVAERVIGVRAAVRAGEKWYWRRAWASPEPDEGGA